MMTLEEARKLQIGDKLTLPAWWLNNRETLCIIMERPFIYKEHEILEPDKPKSVALVVKANDAPGSHSRMITIKLDLVCQKCKKPLKTNGFERWYSNWTIMPNGEDLLCPDCFKKEN